LLRLRLVLATIGLLASTASPTAVVAATGDPSVKAYLDGRPIPLEDVSRYYCDDFSYPAITCSRSPLVAGLRSTTVQLLASVDYATVYDGTSYSGTWMHVSQDYNALVLIGWNDKISSFRGRNAEDGRFFTDWGYGGSTYTFCCNQNFPSLGAYDNTFSSVKRI